MKMQLIYNAIKTPDGTILNSKNRHDYIQHLDKNGETYINDGGVDYFRRSVNIEPYIDVSLYSDAPHEQIREKISRGGRGKNSDEYLKYVLLKDIGDEWLQSMIKYEEEHRPLNRFLPIYKNEQLWRQK